MKVGDYVRTKYGITQFKEYETTNGSKILCMPVKDGSQGIFANVEDVIKSSPNITDLIEVGDYVNGVLVESIYQREKDKLYIHSFDTEIMMCFTNNNIETIVTKEQFESMEYRIGE